jgi:hypothetical protein
VTIDERDELVGPQRFKGKIGERFIVVFRKQSSNLLLVFSGDLARQTVRSEVAANGQIRWTNPGQDRSDFKDLIAECLVGDRGHVASRPIENPVESVAHEDYRI